MNYGSTAQKEVDPKPEVSQVDPQVEPQADADAYWRYYYGEKAPETSDPNYPAWYAYYYGDAAAQSQGIVKSF